MKKKVYLTNITGAYQVVLPYSCGLLHAYCLKDDSIITHYSFQDYLFHVPEGGVIKLADQIDNPGVLALSLLNWNLNRSLKLGKIVKERYPDCLVVVGGPDVPDNAKSFLQKNSFVDIAVHKEGEETFSQILKALAKDSEDIKKVDGITARTSDNEIYFNPRTKKLINPVDTPSPYLLGLFDHCLEYVDKLGTPRVNVWETNRGCPFSCTYCDWGSSVNQRLRILPDSKVDAEINHIVETYDEVHLTDANFGILPRDLVFAKKLRHFMNSGCRLKSIHLNYTKNLNKNAIEIAKIMETLKPSRAGFTFAAQTFDQKTLKNVKRDNIPTQNYEAIKETLEEHDIPTNAELILGLPGETKESFLNGVENSIDLGIDDLRTYQVTVYENAEMNSRETREKFQLKTKSVVIVEGDEEDENEYVEMVCATRSFSAEEMVYVKKMIEMMDHIYFGKWTFYLAHYFKRERGIKIVDFYDSLATYFFTKKDSILGRINSGYYINHWNSGSWNKYRGPRSPFNIHWGNNFFRKGTFFWLVIAEKREDFFKEIEMYFKESGMWDEKVADLVNFQNSMIIGFDYDPNVGANKDFSFDWLDYFRNKNPLKRSAVKYSFQDKTIGRFEKPLVANDPQSYFHVAGGYQFHFQKIGSFEFKNVKSEKVMQNGIFQKVLG